MDMTDLTHEIAKGARARQLLENEVYKEAIGKVRQGIVDKWSESPIGDKEGQFTLRLMLKLLNDLEGNIKDVALTGKMAEVQAEQKRGVVQRFREAFR